jgi:hypothetical protein
MIALVFIFTIAGVGGPKQWEPFTYGLGLHDLWRQRHFPFDAYRPWDQHNDLDKATCLKY